MTADKLMDLIRTGTPAEVLAALAKFGETERRKIGPDVLRAFRKVCDTSMVWDPDKENVPLIADTDSIRVALLACCVPSDFRTFHYQIFPNFKPLEEIFSVLKPSWTQSFVTSKLKDTPFFATRLAPLWQSGLCERPDSDSIILSYYAIHNGFDTDTPEFFEQDVWRFFEVEGGGEFSLASHDKYTHPDRQWSGRLLHLCAQGRLDRQRLLDASLDALDRDFAQFRAGWYSRFHLALAPDIDEMASRSDRYLRLVSSDIPPTVSFAIKALKQLQKAGLFDAAEDAPALAPALMARQKATVKTALQMLKSAAVRRPESRVEIARLSVGALVSEAADVQNAVLDLIMALDAAGDPDIRDGLDAHKEFVAPSVRQRLTEMTGADHQDPQQVPASAAPQMRTPVRIEPVENFDGALGLFLTVLEDPRDPFEVERAVDGLIRYAAGVDREVLSPLKARSQTILKSDGECAVRWVLALTGAALSTAHSMTETAGEQDKNRLYRNMDEGAFSRVLFDRNAQVLDIIARGYRLPLLSMPSDTSGCVLASDLAGRLAEWRTAGVTPAQTDFALALLRLGAEGRDPDLLAADAAMAEERMLAAVMCATVPDEGPAELRAAAWAAGQTCGRTPQVAIAQGGALADTGTAAKLVLRAERRESGPYHWPHVRVDVSPERRTSEPGYLAALFYPPAFNMHWEANPAGSTYADIAWTGLIRPGYQEPFFRLALLALEADQKLTDHHCRAYLEPLLRPGPDAGPLAAATLAYYLASSDKSVTSLTVGAIAGLVLEGRLKADALAEAIRAFVAPDILPFKRWTDGLAALAEISPDHAAFVRRVAAGILELPPEIMPRQSSSLLELMYELHVAAGTPVLHDPARAHLAGIRAGGKAGRFARKLTALGT